jgi:hypothetical protein
MEAPVAELSYYMAMRPEERLSIGQFLREEYWKFNGAKGNASRKDYLQFLRLLNKHRVKYCLIGS